jgi:hypothetical protein
MPERHLQIAGLRAWVRVDDADLLERASASWASYTPVGDAEPDVVVEIQTDSAFLGAAPARTEPGYDARALGDGITEYTRRNSRGQIRTSNGQVRARFLGQPLIGVVEGAVRLAFAEALPARGGLLLHASSMAFGERGLVCMGVSGAGKSTLARLAGASATPPQALGDELAVVRRVGAAGFSVFATPFFGTNAPVPAGHAPLVGLVFPEQASRHQARLLARPEALRRLLRNVIFYGVAAPRVAAVLGVAAHLVAAVPAHALEFARDIGVAAVLREL